MPLGDLRVGLLETKITVSTFYLPVEEEVSEDLEVDSSRHLRVRYRGVPLPCGCRCSPGF